MKNILYALLLFSSLAFSQSSGITYQAVIYNPNGEELPGIDNPYAPLVNQDICLQFGIVDADGNVEYQEEVQVTTDAFGMVNLLIGTNTQTGGYAADFAGIEWSADAKFLKVDLDIKGNCTDFEELSYQPFTYVPFAYYSPASDVPGPEGPQGPAGANGQDGAEGLQGPAGPTGQAGPAGAQGLQGEPGPAGATGADGVSGTNGAAGADGATGPQGQDGVDGLDGATGLTGPAGANGQDGATGPAGPAGSQGDQGLQGPQGIAGTDGQDGAQGPQGLQGPPGTDGAQGPVGSGGVSSGSPQKIAGIGDYKWDIPGWEFDTMGGDTPYRSIVNNTSIIYYPIHLSKQTNYSAIGFFNGSSSNNINMRVGIFSFSNGLPGALLLDLGIMNTPNVYSFHQVNRSFSLDAGSYFVALTSESQGLNAYTTLNYAMRFANNSSVRGISPSGSSKKLAGGSSQNPTNVNSGNSFVFSKNPGQVGFGEVNPEDFIEMTYGGCILFKEDNFEQSTMCDQNIWMTENLNVKYFRNGDLIPEVQDPSEWENLTSPAWCYYNGDPENEELYGVLYNWYAVSDPRGLAPLGWHISTAEEVDNLITCLGGPSVAGGKMKTTGTIESGNGTWLSPNLGATNESGWNGRGSGAIGLNSSTPPQAIFFNLGNFESYWTSTVSDSNPNLVYSYTLNSYSSASGLGLQNGPIQGSPGFSIRCVKN